MTRNQRKRKKRENRGAMAIFPSRLEIFRRQNTKDSKNDMKLQYSL